MGGSERVWEGVGGCGRVTGCDDREGVDVGRVAELVDSCLISYEKGF